MSNGLQNLFQKSKEAEQYFDALPTHIKETLKQSAVDICSERELRQCAETLMNGDNAQANQ